MLLLASTSGGGSVGGGGGGFGSYVKRVLLTGGAIVVPAVLTVYITLFIVNFLSQFLTPGVILVQDALGFSGVSTLAIQMVTALVFLATIFVIGALAESRYGDGNVEQRFDHLMSRIPGIGSIYSNLNEISELLLERDTESFQEVKIVEFPHEQSYMLGFVTADEPAVVEESTGHVEMTTLFAPIGPNPFMGGFIVHLPEDRVYEIDMTVEEGIQTIVSSGVVIDDPDELDDHRANP